MKAQFVGHQEKTFTRKFLGARGLTSPAGHQNITQNHINEAMVGAVGPGLRTQGPSRGCRQDQHAAPLGLSSRAGSHSH